jgi:hypothetical protein
VGNCNNRDVQDFQIITASGSRKFVYLSTADNRVDSGKMVNTTFENMEGDIFDSLKRWGLGL